MILWSKYHIKKYDTYIYNKRVYTNCILAFDTETTTAFKINGKWVAQNYNENPDIYSEAEKRSFVYIWQLAINNDVIYGRDISEFFIFWRKFIKINSSTNIVFVHNLGYDFSFMWEFFPTDDCNLFCKAPYKPMKIQSKTMCIEMRCTYMLTNMSLDKCADEFNLSVSKQTGTMAYNVLRLPNTPLFDNELKYCEFDVRVIVALIKEYFLPQYERIAAIPLTQTGTVRRVVREILNKRRFHYSDMQKCKPDLALYDKLTRVLAGGYTHLNFMWRDELISDVASFDKSSSYPQEMCTQKFPMSPFMKRNINEPLNFNNYSYIMLIEFSNIRLRGYFSYISRHKMKECKNGKIDNGKVYACEYGLMWVTDVDYKIICDFYKIEDGGYIKIKEVWRSYKTYLPRELIDLILDKYGEKTALKNIPEKKGIYARSKQLINCIFGMMLTNIIHDDIKYNNDLCAFLPIEPKTDEQIAEELLDAKPFLSYAWGVWVTAYGRDDIYRVLCKIGQDCVYSDTDSAKIINRDKWQFVFDDFNREAERRIDNVCSTLKLDKSKFYPVDKNGVKHPLGYFEYEGTYSLFKSLGSKKYAFVKDGKFDFTVAGLRKKYIDIDGEHITMPDIKQFNLNAKIPNGRTTHWYLNQQKPLTLHDDLGNSYTVTNRCGIAMCNTFFTFNDEFAYSRFILDVRNKFTNYFRIT